MNAARVVERGLQIDSARGARLAGYRLVFNKVAMHHPDIAHANIALERDSHVEGVVYDLSTEAEILKMDPFERAPWNYGRDAVLVESEIGEEWCWTYFANPAVISEGRLPSADYLAHLLAGEKFLSNSYWEYLAAHETASSEN
jgi:gamma-glutamylcyclotransferase (GGCT)/AIG2-like uncharacterized protein YtfP